ncbi:endonuclease domain-containing protein, partial [Rhodopseudomonas sp. BAL398]|uniref:endonuclease domain-containing protein n=1 Tax=Rhodopseudomonas sp. BAL398 TaxID=3034676 RepID=UPI0023E1507B
MNHAKVNQRQRDRAKQLRQAMTPAETLLWRYLKAHRIDGLGFRRQMPIKNFIVDFVCLAAKLIVELDGESHNFESQLQADDVRDAFFASEGFAVLRFTNDQVMSDLEGVIEVVRQTARARIRSLPPSRGRPPPRGRGAGAHPPGGGGGGGPPTECG